MENSNQQTEQICWRPIEQYFESARDWVLVRMYDLDFKCIPCVAEYNRRDGKWHMNNSTYEVLPFPVLEFADMELIPEQQIEDMSESAPVLSDTNTPGRTKSGFMDAMMSKFNRMV